MPYCFLQGSLQIRWASTCFPNQGHSASGHQAVDKRVREIDNAVEPDLGSHTAEDFLQLWMERAAADSLKSRHTAGGHQRLCSGC